MSQEVPIPEKLLLTIKEAAIYSNIGINPVSYTHLTLPTKLEV